MSNVKTRSTPLDEDPFPPCAKFQHKTKLPTYKDVIGMIRFYTLKKHASNQVMMEVSKRV